MGDTLATPGSSKNKTNPLTQKKTSSQEEAVDDMKQEESQTATVTPKRPRKNDEVELPASKVKSNHKANPKKISCALCTDDKTYSRSSLLVHLTSKHFYKELSNKYMKTLENGSCILCPSTFKAKGSLLTHLGTVHEKILDFCPEKIKESLANA